MIRWANDILDEVAKRNGVSLEEVMQQISACISIGMETAKQENNKKALAIWEAIPGSGDRPTPEELLVFLVGKIKEDL